MEDAINEALAMIEQRIAADPYADDLCGGPKREDTDFLRDVQAKLVKALVK